MTAEQSNAVPKKPSSKTRRSAARLAAQAAQASSPPTQPAKDQQAFQSYLTFLSLVARTHAGTMPDDIDPNETALLEIVILSWAKDTPMTVRQTIAMAHLGSPATLHKRLMRLRAKNYLQLQDVAGDRRVKLLVPGQRGLDYVETMGRYLLKAKRSAGMRPLAAKP
jgi:hypothetical protein